MTNTSVPKTTREHRGLQLFRERGEEIHHIKGTVWAVPSCSGEGLYLVELGSGACTCGDMPPAGEWCKHVVAASIVRVKTGTCAGCGARVRHRHLHPVPEDHLTFLEGDQL